MRRVVTGFLIGTVLIMGFVSEFSSLATFAGFVTAGIAVGLQAILLSIAAYFFVVGRYGIRVGDRISIAGVTGDVIDIGLVRFYLMELVGTVFELTPPAASSCSPTPSYSRQAHPSSNKVPAPNTPGTKSPSPLRPRVTTSSCKTKSPRSSKPSSKNIAA